MIPHCGNYPGDRSSTTVTGEAKSTFIGGTPIIGSKTLFFKSQLDLERYWQETVQKAFATCEAHLYATSRKANIKAKTLFAKLIPLGATGSDRAVAYRRITRVSTPGYAPTDWYQTRVFLSSGRGLSMLEIGEAVRPCLCYTSFARVLALRLIDAARG
jgi:hypothetical protein